MVDSGGSCGAGARFGAAAVGCSTGAVSGIDKSGIGGGEGATGSGATAGSGVGTCRARSLVSLL